MNNQTFFIYKVLYYNSIIIIIFIQVTEIFRSIDPDEFTSNHK